MFIGWWIILVVEQPEFKSKDYHPQMKRGVISCHSRKEVFMGSFVWIYFLWSYAERLYSSARVESNLYMPRRSDSRFHQKVTDSVWLLPINYLVRGSSAVPQKQKVTGGRWCTVPAAVPPPLPSPRNAIQFRDVLVTSLNDDTILSSGFNEKGHESSFGNSLAKLHKFGVCKLKILTVVNESWWTKLIN
jgi:hypothetical protein